LSEEKSGVMEFNLASILNIIWRRRLIVLALPLLGLIVGLLYGSFGTKRWSATATVRPGITSYTPEGFPIRQWQMKDITTWYENRLFGRELNDRLGLPTDFRAVIRADFIATGLTNLAGGEVVTLWTTGTSPELARALIDTSITMFREYAEGDTLSSQIELTRDGLELQIQVLETRFTSVDRQEVSLNLNLEQVRADSLLVSVLDQELGIDLSMLAEKIAFFEKRIEALTEARPGLQADLSQLETVIGEVVSRGKDEVDPGDIPAWARREAVLDEGDVLDGLGVLRLRLQNQLRRNTSVRDSVAYELGLARLELKRKEIKREATVAARLREIEKRIGDLELERDFVLPVKRREVRTDISGKQVQLQSLTSLQQVGETIVSDKPVRPRGLRATMILVFLGIIGGLVLGFTLDYLLAHRREIFRS
jgi:hypothetical protein